MSYETKIQNETTNVEWIVKSEINSNKMLGEGWSPEKSTSNGVIGCMINIETEVVGLRSLIDAMGDEESYSASEVQDELMEIWFAITRDLSAALEHLGLPPTSFTRRSLQQ